MSRVEAEFNIESPLKLRTFACWQGGLAPAQDPLRLNIRTGPSGCENLQVTKLELLIKG